MIFYLDFIEALVGHAAAQGGNVGNVAHAFPSSFPNPVQASNPEPTIVPVIGVGRPARTPSSIANVRARPVVSFFRCFWIRNTGRKTARKQSGIAMIQTGGSHRNIAQRLSTAARMRAESA